MALSVLRVSQRWFSLLLTGLLSLALPSYAEETDETRPTVCVFYPDVPPPNRLVFLDILRGIESRFSPQNLCSRALEEPTDRSSLKQYVAETRPRVVVTLGRVATQAFEATRLSLPQIIGALDLSPATRPSASGVSLTVDPEVLFQRLQRIVPTVKRVFVVYDPRRDSWIIERAKAAAASLGLELRAETASNIIESAPIYGRWVRSAKSATDAIWLTSNSSLAGDMNLVGYLIEKSWLRRVIVFSNILEHARAGVLFATYPDTENLGRRLGTMAEQAARTPDKPLGIEPLRDIRVAFNVRIARHLPFLPRIPVDDVDMVFGNTESEP